MAHDPRPHIRRRRHAIGRLRSLTTGTAIVGLAGVAGFGTLAAATWSGDPAANAGAGSATTETSGRDNSGTSGSDVSGGTTPRSVAPNAAATRPQPTATPTPTVQRSKGAGHAATGGSH